MLYSKTSARAYRPATCNEVLTHARDYLSIKTLGSMIDSPSTARSVLSEYLKTGVAAQDRELFAVAFLNSRHRLTAIDVLFYGSLNSATVHPREVARRALAYNAAAVVLIHNHPSGDSEPSQSDRVLTTKITEALNLLEVRVLDHLVVGMNEVCSFAERGWM